MNCLWFKPFYQSGKSLILAHIVVLKKKINWIFLLLFPTWRYLSDWNLECPWCHKIGRLSYFFKSCRESLAFFQGWMNFLLSLFSIKYVIKIWRFYFKQPSKLKESKIEWVLLNFSPWEKKNFIIVTFIIFYWLYHIASHTHGT